MHWRREVVEEDGGAVGGDSYDDPRRCRSGVFRTKVTTASSSVSPCAVKDFGEAGLRGARGWRSFKRGSAMVRAAEPERRTMPMRRGRVGGDGYDGVFELAHVGFLMVTGEKKMLGWWRVFLQGFCEKVVCRTWFLMVRLWWIAGENMVRKTHFR